MGLDERKPCSNIGSSKIVLAILTTIMTVQMANAIRDPPHCDQSGFPSCYTVGYNHGLADSNADAVRANGDGCDASIPSHHSAEFGRGYTVGYAAGQCGHINSSANTVGPTSSSCSAASSSSGSSSSASTCVNTNNNGPSNSGNIHITINQNGVPR